MKKLTKRFIVPMLTMIFFIQINMVCFAAETEAVQEEQVGEGECLLTFTLTDKTKGSFTEEITITLMNLNTNKEYNYNMTSTDYHFGLAVGGTVEKGTYNIALYYAGREQFRILNTDGTAITSVDANEGSYAFDWVVEDNRSSETVQKNVAEKKTEEYSVISDHVFAEEIFRDFMDSILVLETDSKYAAIMQYYDNTKDVYAHYYAVSCEGKSEEDYLSMTPLEQFMWYETYVTPVMASTYNDYNTYFETIDKWNANVVGNAYNLLQNQGADKQAEDYKTLMEWQYYYFKENGAFYNFMTGYTSLEEDNNLEDSLSDELLGDETDGMNEDKGIWSDTAALLKGSVFTLVILCIFASAYGGVILYRRRKAIDEDKDF